LGEPEKPAQRILSPGFATEGIASAGDYLVWPTNLGYLHVFNAKKGQMAFRMETRAAVELPISHGPDNTLVIATNDGMILAANAESGSLLWQALVSDTVVQQPLIHQNTVCFVTHHGNLGCLDARNGTQLWRRTRFRRWAGIVDGHLMAVDHQSQLVKMRLADGVTVGASPLGDLDLLVSQNMSDRVFLSNGSGHVIALRPIGGVTAVIHAPWAVEPVAEEATDVTKPEAAAKPEPDTVETPPAEPEVPAATEDDPFGEADPLGGGEDDPFGGEDTDNPFEGMQ
jgi:hypothetical protein